MLKFLQSIHQLPTKFVSILDLEQVRFGPLKEVARQASQSQFLNNFLTQSFTISLGMDT